MYVGGVGKEGGGGKTPRLGINFTKGSNGHSCEEGVRIKRRMQNDGDHQRPAEGIARRVH